MTGRRREKVRANIVESPECVAVRAVIQRVRSASVQVDGETTGEIGHGLLVLLGVRRGDGENEIRYVADKILGLRIFPDEKYPMNVSLEDVRGEVLLVSQFTLYGDCRRGRRPSFDAAELPERAGEIYTQFVSYLTRKGCPPREGVFVASMLVTLENEGPVTILLDSEKSF